MRNVISNSHIISEVPKSLPCFIGFGTLKLPFLISEFQLIQATQYDDNLLDILTKKRQKTKPFMQ